MYKVKQRYSTFIQTIIREINEHGFIVLDAEKFNELMNDEKPRLKLKVIKGAK